MENFRQFVNKPVTMDLHVKSIRVPGEGPVRDFAVFCGIDSRGESVVCTGIFPGLSVGLPVRVNGTYQLHRDSASGTENLEIKANGCAFLQFTSLSEIRQYLIGLGIPGCGPKTIDRIIEEYGIDTVCPFCCTVFFRIRLRQHGCLSTLRCKFFGEYQIHHRSARP